MLKHFRVPGRLAVKLEELVCIDRIQPLGACRQRDMRNVRDRECLRTLHPMQGCGALRRIALILSDGRGDDSRTAQKRNCEYDP